MSESARERAAKMAVRLALPALHQSLAHAIERGRYAARAVAKDDLSSHVHAPALEDVRDHGDDAPRAYSAAAGLTASWGSLSMGAISSQSSRSLEARLGEVGARFESRLRRTAATEAAHSFNEARGRILAAHADVHDVLVVRKPLLSATDPMAALYAREESAARSPLRIVPQLPPQGPYRDAPPPPPPVNLRAYRAVKIWSAMLDGHVCDVCRAMHGTVVLARDEFPGGDPPRHPFCRCIPVLLMTAAALDDIERAYEQMAA